MYDGPGAISSEGVVSVHRAEEEVLAGEGLLKGSSKYV